jgi:hypothetical protein
MTSVTTTQTSRLEPPNSLFLNLRLTPQQAPSPINYTNLFREILDPLLRILGEHQNMTDHLSRRLHSWGAEVVRLSDPIVRGESALNEASERDARQLIDHLRNTILVNPLTAAPLGDPVLDGNHVWERDALNDYRQTLLNLGMPEAEHVSPFNQGPLAPASHDFARKMILWMQSLPPSNPTTNILTPFNSTRMAIYLRAPIPVEAAMDSLPPAEKLYAYLHLAQNAVVMEQLEDFRLESLQTRTSNQQLRIAVRAAIAAAIEQANIDAAEHTRALNERIEGIEQSHQMEVNAVGTRVEEVNRQNEMLANITRETKTRCISLETQVNQLWASNANLRNQIEDLGQRVGKGGGCTIL